MTDMLSPSSQDERSVLPQDRNLHVTAGDLLDPWELPDVLPPQSPGERGASLRSRPAPSSGAAGRKRRKKRAPRSADGARSAAMGIRLHPQERAAIRAAARRARRDDPSGWAREVLLAAAAREDIPFVGDEALEELLRLRRDLNSGVGANLNQAMLYANREAKMGRAPDRRALLEAVEAARAGLEALRAELERVIHPRGRR